MKKILSILAIITLAALLIVPANAALETRTGTLGGTGAVSSSSWTLYTGSNTARPQITGEYLYTNAIQTTSGTTAIIIYRTIDYGTLTTDGGAPSGASTHFKGYIGTTQVCEGTIGYQRIYNSGGTEGASYIFATFDQYDVSGFTGAQSIRLVFDRGAIYNAVYSSTPQVANTGNNNLLFTGSATYYTACASFTHNTRPITYASYSAQKPSGLGIAGTVSKTSSGTKYLSKASIFDGASGAILANENTQTSLDFIFNVAANSIIIGIQDGNGNWYNSSVLFASAVKYTLEVTPETGTTTTAYSAKSTADSGVAGATLDAFTIVCNSGSVSGKCLSNSTDPSFIKKADGYWYQADASYQYSIKWPSFPAILPLTFDTPGSYTVKAVYYPVGLDGVSAQDTVTVESVGTMRKLTVLVQDWSSGALISDAAVQIINSAGTWSNATTTGGIRTYSAKNGEYIGIAASAPGYLDSSLTYSQIARDTTKTIILSKYIEVPVGNNTLYVYTRDSSTHNNLEGALVRLNDGQTKTTPGSGLATFTVLEGGTYQITVSKSGYHTLTRTLIVAGSANAISMEVSPLYITTAPTLAPGETATPTPLPTVDTRTDAQKDRAMMSLIRDNAEALILVAIVMTFLYLVGYKP